MLRDWDRLNQLEREYWRNRLLCSVFQCSSVKRRAAELSVCCPVFGASWMHQLHNIGTAAATSAAVIPSSSSDKHSQRRVQASGSGSSFLSFFPSFLPRTFSSVSSVRDRARTLTLVFRIYRLLPSFPYPPVTAIAAITTIV